MSAFASLLDTIRRLLSRLVGLFTSAPTPASPVVGDEPLLTLTPRVLVIVYDPIVDRASGMKLSQRMKWQNVGTLIADYIADIDECSGGRVKYHVVEQVEADGFPVLSDGFKYDAARYLDLVSGRAQPHQPDMADYRRIVTDFNLLARVSSGEIDEAWLFAFPYGGFYESRMAGRRAFWCNAPPLENSEQSSRRFVIMGFSYERGVGEMLESFSHRAEGILEKVFERISGEANLFKRFTLYDKIAPGRAEVGTVHYAPNSDTDYDWDNPRMVPSRCDDWLNFPSFQNVIRRVNRVEWGNGDIRLHHTWWLKHLPKVAGHTNGISNNWWKYVVDPNNV